MRGMADILYCGPERVAKLAEGKNYADCKGQKREKLNIVREKYADCKG